jgi:hypothetical protein
VCCPNAATVGYENDFYCQLHALLAHHGRMQPYLCRESLGEELLLDYRGRLNPGGWPH